MSQAVAGPCNKLVGNNVTQSGCVLPAPVTDWLVMECNTVSLCTASSYNRSVMECNTVSLCVRHFVGNGM